MRIVVVWELGSVKLATNDFPNHRSNGEISLQTKVLMETFSENFLNYAKFFRQLFRTRSQI